MFGAASFLCQDCRGSNALGQRLCEARPSAGKQGLWEAQSLRSFVPSYCLLRPASQNSYPAGNLPPPWPGWPCSIRPSFLLWRASSLYGILPLGAGFAGLRRFSRAAASEPFRELAPAVREKTSPTASAVWELWCLVSYRGRIAIADIMPQKLCNCAEIFPHFSCNWPNKYRRR